MVVDVPFITWAYAKTDPLLPSLGGTYILYIAHGDTEVASWAMERSSNHLYHRANDQFIETYSQILPVGNVTRWNRKKDFKIWIDSIVYHSFVKYSIEGIEQVWMMRDIPTYDITTRTTIPIGFRASFHGENNIVWILLKNGNKAWPVEVVNNVFSGGWSEFRNDHELRPNHKLIFGCERQWIFTVFVLDDNHKQVLYPWSQPNPLWVNIYPVPGNLLTSTLPSTLAGQNFCARFGDYYVHGNNMALVFDAHLNEVFRNRELRQVIMRVGISACIVPVHNRRLDNDAFHNFMVNLDLETLDYLFVSITNEAEMIIIVFDDFGTERIYEWF